jgi:hypothetical protein
LRNVLKKRKDMRDQVLICIQLHMQKEMRRNTIHNQGELLSVLPLCLFALLVLAKRSNNYRASQSNTQFQTRSALWRIDFLEPCE